MNPSSNERMNLFSIASVLEGKENLRDIPANQIKSWAEYAGEQLADFKELRGYFHTIVEKISSVLSECKSAVLRKEKPNYDDLILQVEPHIGYKAGRSSNRREENALIGLKKVISNSLNLISSSQKDDEILADLTRLNQLFQAMAAYYTEKRKKKRGG